MEIGTLVAFAEDKSHYPLKQSPIPNSLSYETDTSETLFLPVTGN